MKKFNLSLVRLIPPPSPPPLPQILPGSTRVSVTRSEMNKCLEPLLPRLINPVREACILGDICLLGDASPFTKEKLFGGKEGGRKAARMRDTEVSGNPPPPKIEQSHPDCIIVSNPAHKPPLTDPVIQISQAKGGRLNWYPPFLSKGRPRSSFSFPCDSRWWFNSRPFNIFSPDNLDRRDAHSFEGSSTGARRGDGVRDTGGYTGRGFRG